MPNDVVEVQPVTIFGKDSCPYTQSALAAYEKRGLVEYVNVKKDAAGLTRMLELSQGQRRVPVILEHGVVTIGFGGT